MKKLILAVLVISTSLMFSCKSNSGDPKMVLSSFMEALAKKDIAAARKLSTTDSKMMLDMMEMGMKNEQSTDSKKYDMANMEFGEPKIDGDKATVPVKEKTTGESINYALKKENGEWKVAFDKASLMGTVTDKLNEKGLDMKGAMDSLSKGMENMKDVDMDSLKESMDQGMKSLDSMKNILKNN